MSVKAERVRALWIYPAPKSPRTISTERILLHARGRSSFQLSDASEVSRVAPSRSRASAQRSRISRETGASSLTASPRSAAIFTSLAIKPQRKTRGEFSAQHLLLDHHLGREIAPVDTFKISTMVS